MYRHLVTDERWMPLPQSRPMVLVPVPAPPPMSAVRGARCCSVVAPLLCLPLALTVLLSASQAPACCSTWTSTLYSFGWFWGSSETTTITTTATMTTTSTPTTTSATKTTTSSTTLVELRFLDLQSPGQTCFFDYNNYQRAGGAAATCFCQLAGNPGCADVPCQCKQGCNVETFQHEHSITFRNSARAQYCSDPTALLTIPRSNYDHIQFLISWCRAGAPSLLVELLIEGFNSYQTVSPGPVKQCIHAGAHVTVPWLHLHTICEGGMVDNMRGDNHTSWCGIMTDASHAVQLAAQIMEWAGGPTFEEANKLTQTLPQSCQAIGCGMDAPKGQHSCSWTCRTFGNCFDDYHDTCLGTCAQMGCGHVVSDADCSCAATCVQQGDCCPDFHSECRELPLAGHEYAGTCAELGCGVVGRKCACNPECDRFGDCCPDVGTCRSPSTPVRAAVPPQARPTAPPSVPAVASGSCRDVGCGNRGPHCDCNDACHAFKDCCADFEGVCPSTTARLV